MAKKKKTEIPATTDVSIEVIIWQAVTQIGYTPQQFEVWQMFNTALKSMLRDNSNERVNTPKEFICLP